MSASARTARVTATLLGATCLSATLAAPALAGPPVVETVDRTFVNGFLSEQCGVEVTQHLWGSYSSVAKDGRTITNYRFRSTLTAGDEVVDSRAFGPTIEVQQADGSMIVTQLGVTMRNLPGSGTAGPFAGRSVVRLVLDADGEVVEEAPLADAGLRQDLTELCAALTAGSEA